MNPKKTKEIFKRFQKNNPHPTTELQYTNNFELLVSVILSARATDVSVNKATTKLFPTANTPQAIIKLGEEGLMSYIKTIGLYKNKAKNILKTCQILIEKHNGEVPGDRDSLEALPGVGRKTANVVLNTAFSQPTMAVDTHIFRVANRIKLAAGKTPLTVEQQLLKIIPKQYMHDAHHWLILHGRYVCVARKPHCSICLINDLCEFENKNWD